MASGYSPMADERCPAGDAAALARTLVRIDSRNPSLAHDGPGERESVRVLKGILDGWGFRTSVVEPVPGRPSLVATIGSPGPRSLMLNGHLDVVGTEGMLHEPFGGIEHDGRLYARGAADMKGGVAAMCAAAWRAANAGALAGEVVVAAVADEEWGSLGTRALLDAGVRADAAIVTEPTRLAIVPAHRGFVWVEITVLGRAAHGSRYDLGEDAIRLAAHVLVELDLLERDVLCSRTHPLLGHASLHAATIEGGVGFSTYPDRCVLRVERRTLPGETEAQVLAEMEQVVERVRARYAPLRATVAPAGAQLPSEVAASAPIVGALRHALEAEGEDVRVDGLGAWTDAALLNAAGIPAICFGPGDISLAHADEEWLELDELERATKVLARLVGDWTRGAAGTWQS